MFTFKLLVTSDPDRNSLVLEVHVTSGAPKNKLINK